MPTSISSSQVLISAWVFDPFNNDISVGLQTKSRVRGKSWKKYHNREAQPVCNIVGSTRFKWGKKSPETLLQNRLTLLNPLDPQMCMYVNAIHHSALCFPCEFSLKPIHWLDPFTLLPFLFYSWKQMPGDSSDSFSPKRCAGSQQASMICFLSENLQQLRLRHGTRTYCKRHRPVQTEGMATVATCPTHMLILGCVWVLPLGLSDFVAVTHEMSAAFTCTPFLANPFTSFLWLLNNWVQPWSCEKTALGNVLESNWFIHTLPVTVPLLRSTWILLLFHHLPYYDLWSKSCPNLNRTISSCDKPRKTSIYTS